MAKMNITPRAVAGVIFVAIALLYLFNTFFIKADTGYTFQMPTNINQPVMWLIRLAIVTVAVTIAITVLNWLTDGSISKKDIFSIILIGVVVYFTWTYVVGPIWKAPSIDQIAWKLGLLKP